MNRKIESPLELITSRPQRRCRTESILRLLMSTSYPHATLANLTIDISRRGGMTEEAELERVATELREIERGFELFDFIRCLEIKRSGMSMKVIVKRLKIDAKMKEIKDTVHQHEFLASSNISLETPEVELENVEELAAKVLEMYFCSQMRNKTMGTDIATTTWICRSKTVTAEGTKLDSLATKPVDEQISYQDAVAIIVESLKKNRFHVIVTQNTILLLDQAKRIWGLNAQVDEKA